MFKSPERVVEARVVSIPQDVPTELLLATLRNRLQDGMITSGEVLFETINVLSKFNERTSEEDWDAATAESLLSNRERRQ